jgi:hypothetical protein
MTKLPRRLDGESPERSVIRKERSVCPGMKKTPVPGGVEAGGVPPVGLEPTTFGLKVRRPVMVWLEHADVLIRNWLARCAAIASNSTIAGNAGNSSSKGVLR